MKRKLLILASTFFLAGCGGNGVSLKEGQKYNFVGTVSISAEEEVKSSFFSMIHEMKDASSLDNDNPFYNVVDAASLGEFFANQYKSLNITYHLNSPKDFFTFTWETSTSAMLGGLNADGTFCDVYGEGNFFENRLVDFSTQDVRCSVKNHFNKLSGSDVLLEMTALIEDFNISSGSYSEKSKAVINVTLPVTK